MQLPLTTGQVGTRPKRLITMIVAPATIFGSVMREAGSGRQGLRPGLARRSRRPSRRLSRSPPRPQRRLSLRPQKVRRGCVLHARVDRKGWQAAWSNKGGSALPPNHSPPSAVKSHSFPLLRGFFLKTLSGCICTLSSVHYPLRQHWESLVR